MIDGSWVWAERTAVNVKKVKEQEERLAGISIRQGFPQMRASFLHIVVRSKNIEPARESMALVDLPFVVQAYRLLPSRA